MMRRDGSPFEEDSYTSETGANLLPEGPLVSHIKTFEPKGSDVRRGHAADMNEWPELGSGQEATNDRMCVVVTGRGRAAAVAEVIVLKA